MTCNTLLQSVAPVNMSRPGLSGAPDHNPAAFDDLALAALGQVFVDALTDGRARSTAATDPRARRYARAEMEQAEQARHSLLNADTCLADLCDVAGLDPGYVVRLAKRLQANDWRKPQHCMIGALCHG